MSAIFSRISAEFIPAKVELNSVRSNNEIIKEAEDLLAAFEPKIKQIEREKEKLNSKIDHLSRYIPILRQCQSLIQEMEKKETLESNIVMFDRRSDIGVVEFEKEIDRRTNGLYELISRRVDENYLAILLLFDKEFKKEIQNYLTSEKISSLAFPPELRTVELHEMNSNIESLISKYKSNLESLEQKKNTIIDTPDFIKLVKIHREIANRLSDFQLAEKMGGTEDTFELEGYIPKSKWKSFELELRNRFDKRILFTKKVAKKNAPVLRKNPRIVKPFETITNLIQLPEYGSIDPTPFVFILFPFFWGFMVGDVGYAVTIFTIATFLRIKFKRNQQQGLQNITEIFMISSVVAMFFGIIYFEIFGDLGEILAHNIHEHHGITIFNVFIPIPEAIQNLLHPILDRYNAVQELLIIAIIIGYGIVLGGMLLGVLNNLRLKHMSHVYGNLMLIFIWGSIPVLLIIAITMPDLFSTVLIIDFLAILLAIVILVRLEGVAGVIHVIEKFSNILSFARLMAIGLVGAWMGKIANNLTTQFFPLGLLMGLGLHMINIVILILSPSIHSMRLNVFEFFSQFVLEGGNTYKPYGIN
jgi:V/A-type H+-transporting ATPase subunit I